MPAVAARTTCSLIFLAACGGAETAPAVTERDSAGIHIIESARPAWTTADGWRLSDRPVLEIGVEDGAEEYQFYRVGGGHRFADGSLLISDAGSHELRFYDSTGRFLRKAGRQGGGPGEFHQYSDLQLWVGPHDTLRVADAGQYRFNVFDPAGTHLDTYALEVTPDLPRVFAQGMFADGSWLALAFVGGGGLQGQPGTVVESEVAYARYDARGRWIGDLFRMPGRLRYVHQFGEIIHYPFIPLTPDAQVDVFGELIVQWTGPGPELVIRNRDGTVRMLVRWQPDRQQSVAAIWDRFRTEDLAQGSDEDQRRRYAHFYDEDLPLPDEVPVIARLLTDTEGNLWALHYRLPWDEELRWDVFDPSGRWLGDVVAPPRVRVLEIGADYVLGRHRDELGVERIHVYRLER